MAGADHVGGWGVLEDDIWPGVVAGVEGGSVHIAIAGRVILKVEGEGGDDFRVVDGLTAWGAANGWDGGVGGWAGRNRT